MVQNSCCLKDKGLRGIYVILLNVLFYIMVING